MAGVLENFLEQAEACTETSLDQVHYIQVAARLLEQLFTELRVLAINNPEFARVMSNVAPDVRLRLGILDDTVRLLSIAKDASSAAQLTRRAKALISWLSTKLDELTLDALGDLFRDVPVPPTVH